MLHVIRSNHVETLLGALARRVLENPPDLPFTPETVLIPGPAMARWVKLKLARVLGVSANIDCIQPASYIWRLARQLPGEVPATDPLERGRLSWKIFFLLPGLLHNPCFSPLARYFEDDESGLKRLQLAQRIADVFDRYQYYRPEMIRQWDRGEADHWQAHLWRQLTRDLAEHRVGTLNRLLAAIPQADESLLPERISVFAISGLPPMFVNVLQSLATRIPVDYFLHSPTDQFWSDLVSEKHRAAKRLEDPENAELWETGNPLLSSWGRQGQALQDLLLESGQAPAEEAINADRSDELLLHRLQKDLFELKPAAVEGGQDEIAADASLQVHICHGPQRECQVLHDELLAMLQVNPDLAPEDILVMVPEISRYAPYITAVFDQDKTHQRPYIPWNLSDTSTRDEHPLVRVFLKLLELPTSRFTHSDVLSCLDVPELTQRFDLEAEDIVSLRAWLQESRLHWGLDQAHKSRLGVPGTAQNTWAQARDRLFAGYAMGDAPQFDGIAPVGSVEGRQAGALGRMWRFLSRLEQTAKTLDQDRSAAEWEIVLGRLLKAFFGDNEDEDGRLQKMRDVLATLAEQTEGVDDVLSLELVRDWLNSTVGEESRYGRYFSGGVTFCGMRPMRSLPFRVICILGLDDNAYPRRERTVEFDLMQRKWRPGDPRRADEDRYLFLESLLCARDTLYLSYTGRDIRRNNERQPSVLVRELLDYVDGNYRLAGSEESVTGALTRVHPLQPFSPRNYDTEHGSFDPDWCTTAQVVSNGQEVNSDLESWPLAPLPEADDSLRDVSLSQLLRFVRHPVRYFCQTRLGISLHEDDPPEDEEPFSLDGLQRYQLGETLVRAWLQGDSPGVTQLSATGVLPHGSAGRTTLSDSLSRLAELRQSLAPYVGLEAHPVPVELSFETEDRVSMTLSGQVEKVYPALGLLH